MSLRKCSLLALAILLGAMLSRPINGCMLADDPTTPRKHVIQPDGASQPGGTTQLGGTGTLACDDADEQFLKESKVATDAPGLMKYL